MSYDTIDHTLHNVNDITEDHEVVHNNKKLFVYKAKEGILYINASAEHILDLGVKEGVAVDLCFPSPFDAQLHYCFHNVRSIRPLKEMGKKKLD